MPSRRDPGAGEQIARGGPVTVTHPEIERYFMSIPEAAQLVLQAGMMGKGGEIYVLDMGEPVKIAELARQLIQLSGFSEQDIRIEYTGLRPGEKLYEEPLADAPEIPAFTPVRTSEVVLGEAGFKAEALLRDDVPILTNELPDEDALASARENVALNDAEGWSAAAGAAAVTASPCRSPACRR